MAHAIVRAPSENCAYPRLLSTSLAGSCFTSETALGPFHHGVARAREALNRPFACIVLAAALRQATLSAEIQN